jgi:ROS/MUCR transcriptional regulator protein
MARYPRFRTRRQVNRYFGGRTIQCLICGKRFSRLSFHLAAKHGITTDEYKSRFGLPWTRGLTSAQSHANSGWTEARRATAGKLARESQFFKYAHPAARREAPEFLKVETLKNLGPNARGFGKQFDSRVRVLFSQGLTDAAIAKALAVNRMTVNRRTKQWRSCADAKQPPEIGANDSNGSRTPGGPGRNSKDRS